MQLFSLNMGMFNCYVTSLEGSHFRRIKQYISMIALGDLSLRLPCLGLYYNEHGRICFKTRAVKKRQWFGLDSGIGVSRITLPTLETHIEQQVEWKG